MLPGVLFLLFASESSNDVLLLLEPGPLTVEPGPRLQAHEYGHQTAPSQPTLHEGQRYCSKIAFQSPQDSMLNLSHLWYLAKVHPSGNSGNVHYADSMVDSMLDSMVNSP